MISSIRQCSINRPTLQTKRENQPAFCGKKAKIAGAVTAIPLALILGQRAALISEFMNAHNEKAFATEISWPANTQVLASTGQNTLGINNAEHSYPNIVIDILAQNKAQTIEAANDSLSNSGYKIAPQGINLKRILNLNAFTDPITSRKKLFPLETPGARLNIFNKNDHNKNRYVLIVSDAEEAQKTIPISNEFKSKMQSIYNIPDNNIIQITAATGDDFVKGIDSIAPKITDQNNSELLIMYTGHGNISPQKNTNPRLEGDLEGMILNDLTESRIKLLLDDKLKQVKTLLMMDNCKSGAWIADNISTTAKALNRIA